MSENVHLLHYTHPCPVKFLTHVLFTVVRLYRRNLRSTDNSKHLFNGVNHCSVLNKYASFLRIACKQVSETACSLHLNIFQQSPYKWYSDRLLDVYLKKLKCVFAEDFFLIVFIGEKGADEFDILFHGGKGPIRAVK